MIIKKSKSQSGNDISDFHDFLKILDDLEENGDHAAIDSSVTKDNQKKLGTDKHECDKYYFDFSGDLNNLKTGFSSSSNLSTKKKKRQNLSFQNVQTFKQNNITEPSNIFPCTKINSKCVQSTPQCSLGNKNRNKNILINFSYRDNFDSYNADTGLSTKPFKGKDDLKIKRGQDTPKQTYQNTVVKEQHNYSPSLCGSTNDEITNDMAHCYNSKILPNNSIEFNKAKSKKFKNDQTGIARSKDKSKTFEVLPELKNFANEFNHKYKKKKRKASEDAESKLNSVVIIDSDSEIAIYTKINSKNVICKEKKKRKKFKNVNTSETSNDDEELRPLKGNISFSNQILLTQNIGKKVNDMIANPFGPPVPNKKASTGKIKEKSLKVNKNPKQNEISNDIQDPNEHKKNKIGNTKLNIDTRNENFGKPRRKEERETHNSVFDIKNEKKLNMKYLDKIDSDVEISHNKLKKKKKAKKDQYSTCNEDSNQMFNVPPEEKFKSEKNKTECDEINKDNYDRQNHNHKNDINWNIKYDDKFGNSFEPTHKKLKNKKRKKDKESDEESNQMYLATVENNLKNNKKYSEYDYSNKKHKKKDTCNNTREENCDIDLNIKFIHNDKINSGLQLPHKKSKKKKKTKKDNHGACNEESVKNYDVPPENQLKTRKNNAENKCVEKLQKSFEYDNSLFGQIKKESTLKKERRKTLDNFTQEHVDENQKHNIFKVDTNWDITEDETNLKKSISNNIIDNDEYEKVEKKKTQNNNHYNNATYESFKHERKNDKHIFGMSNQLDWTDEVDSENAEDSGSIKRTLQQLETKHFDKNCSDKMGKTKKNNHGKDSDKKKNHNISNANSIGDMSDMYDLKFDNIEEINEDFNMGGISFEEDLSLVDKTICINKNVQPALKIRKRKLSETSLEGSDIELDIKHHKTRKISFPVGMKNEEARNISNSAKQNEKAKAKSKMNITLPDLDETRLNVLINLKSKQNNTSIKYSKSPREIRHSDRRGNKVLIDVSYSDSHQHKTHWIIGVKNEIPRDDNFNEQINKNSISLSNNLHSSDPNILQHIKCENIAAEEVMDVKLCKEMENPHNNDPGICSLDFDEENHLLPSKDIKIECSDTENLLNISYESKEILYDKNKMQVSDITNLPTYNLKTQSSSITEDCSNDTENIRICAEENQMVSTPLSETYNEGIAKTEIQYEEKMIIDVHQNNFVGNVEPQEIEHTPALELLKPLQVSTLSNFSNINIINADYTLQNINVEELSPILGNSVSSQQFTVPNCTDNFPIVDEYDENDANIRNVLNFIDNTLVYTPEKNKFECVSKIDPDELIMDLDDFLNLKNVEQLANSLSEKITDDNYTSNIIQICEENGEIINSTAVHFEDNSTCNDELLTNKEKNYSEPENELDQNQHNSSESDDSISESDDTDGSNYSDELKLSRKKGKRLRTIKSSSPVRKYITRRTLLEKIDQEKNIKDTKVNESKCDSSDDLDKIKDSILKCNEQKEKDLKVIITRRTGVEKIHFNSSMEDAKLNETVDLKCSLNQEPRYENSDSSDDCNEKYNSKLIKSVKVKGNSFKVILTRMTGLEEIHSGSNIEVSNFNQTIDSANSFKEEQEQLSANSDFLDDPIEKNDSKLIKDIKTEEGNMTNVESTCLSRITVDKKSCSGDDNHDSNDNEIQDLTFVLNEKRLSESSDCSSDLSEDDWEDIESDEQDSSEESIDQQKPLTIFEREEMRSLRIKLNHTQSPLHQLVTRASNPQKKLIETVRKAKLEIRTGPFSKAEDDIIRNNWESFLKEYELTLPPSAFFSFNSKMSYQQRVLFVKYLSNGLDKRWPNIVHNRFRHIYCNKKWKHGCFSKDEDEMILETRAKSSSYKPFKELEPILNRPAKRIHERFQYTPKQNRKINFRWDLNSIEQLVKLLMKIAKCQDIEELRHKKFSIAEWREVAKHMKELTVHQVKYGWLTCVHHRIFSDDVPLHIMKAELLKKLEDANVSEWRQINWDEIAKDFHGYNATYLNGAFVYLIQRFPREKRKDLKGCLSELRRRFPHETPKRPDHLPATRKVIYKDGRLRYRDEGCDNR